MNRPPFIVLVIAAVIVVAAGTQFVRQWRQRAADDAAPQVQTRVIVIEMREFPASERRSRQQTVAPAGSAMRYEVRFRPQDAGAGSDIICRVTAARYHDMTAGEQGVLTMQGKRFVRFDPLPGR